IKEELTELGTQMSSVMDRLGNVVERSEIAPFMLDFSRSEERREYLFLDGQPMRSDLAYMEIYGRAKRSIQIVDDRGRLMRDFSCMGVVLRFSL
ncbi:MAG: hypothetical protein IJM52_02465, partial [Spirochaetales bacterium]|nr:hypothetical protein [Spirochaetales bacterium]